MLSKWMIELFEWHWSIGKGLAEHPYNTILAKHNRGIRRFVPFVIQVQSSDRKCSEVSLQQKMA